SKSDVHEDAIVDAGEKDRTESPCGGLMIASESNDDDSGSLQDFPVNMSLPFTSSSHSGDPSTDSAAGQGSHQNVITAAINLANPSIEHYIVRFAGSSCTVDNCRMSATNREHFHCRRCEWRVFTKKEEMLRHYKWHRKREESLAHGFMRYSASDGCRMNFLSCVHNLKQTHYHCLQPGCDKVYISTSDVQMHANSHRKAAHIAREGFQRYKASEDCKYNNCPFRDLKLRTTHFHCLRPGCTHSFKNKSDMGE
uniref:C2H2-type domain-containing protein n=1 Tax=Plectus sambesii TaxID=2011161 RepID=A0A914V3V8_9BILA